MTAKLIAITQPVGVSACTPSELLAFCARVSSAANQDNHATGSKLIRSLIARKEWSPLEMVSLTVEVETTRDIARQILRHRSMSFQEFSQRYAKVDSDPVLRQVRLQHATDRQMSIESDDPDLDEAWASLQREAAKITRNIYDEALARGVAKEVARAVLPEGLTLSRLYMAGTLRSFYHWIELRQKLSTQKEHREIAIAVRDIICEWFPDIGESLMNGVAA